MNKLLKELLEQKYEVEIDDMISEEDFEALEEKLDKVGKEDKDVDNDGDVDDSDEYLANRRKKIAAEIKKDKKDDK